MSGINCGRKGHAATECRQAKVEMCPQKPAPSAPLKALEGVPRRVAAMRITDADGFTKVPPHRSGQRLGDFIASAPAPRCNSNSFRLLFLEDWQDVAAKVAYEPEICSSQVLSFSLCALAFPIHSPPTASMRGVLKNIDDTRLGVAVEPR